MVTGQGLFSDTVGELERMQFVAQQMMNRMATATLVEVKAVGTDTVDVQPMVAQLDGAGTAIPHGIIHNVPFFRIRAGSTGIDLRPVIGDQGLAVFCHNDIQGVKRAKAPTTPGSRRRFNWADALYLGGFFGPDLTQFIKIDSSGITITSASAVTINAPSGFNLTGNATFIGDVSVTGNLSSTGNLDGKNFLAHTHAVTGGAHTGPVD